MSSRRLRCSTVWTLVAMWPVLPYVCRGVGPSLEGDVLDVDRDRGHVQVHGAVRVAPEDAPPGGHDETAKGTVLGGVVRNERAAEDLGDVVQAPLEAVGVKVKDLPRVVGRHRGRKRDVQAAPRLPRLVPGRDLAGLDPRVCEYERRREVVPDRVAD